MVGLLLTLLMAQELDVVGPQNAPGRRSQDASLVMEEVFQAKVMSVEDGDSLVVRTLAGNDTITIHIAGVDAPEMSQPGGVEAKAFLADLVSGHTVTVRIRGTSERLAQVDVAGSDVSFALIQNGLAWHCPRFAKENVLAAAEAEARRMKRGLWSRPQPTPPWLYRGAGVCWEQQKAPAKSHHRPDFSGRWMAISPVDRVGQELTIVQDASSLTIRDASLEPAGQLTYKLEGPTSRSFTTAHGPADIVAKSRWTDGVWTVDERQWMVRGEEPRNVRRRIWLDDQGFLNFETASPRPIGEYDATVVRYRLSVVSRN